MVDNGILHVCYLFDTYSYWSMSQYDDDLMKFGCEMAKNPNFGGSSYSV